MVAGTPPSTNTGRASTFGGGVVSMGMAGESNEPPGCLPDAFREESRKVEMKLEGRLLALTEESQQLSGFPGRGLGDHIFDLSCEGSKP